MNWINTSPVMRDHVTVDEAQAAQITGLTTAALAKLRRDMLQQWADHLDDQRDSIYNSVSAAQLL